MFFNSKRPVHDVKVVHSRESCVGIKIKLNFYFQTSLWCLKRSYEAFKAFIFFSSSGIGAGKVKKTSKVEKSLQELNG